MKNVLLYLANAYYTIIDNANIQYNGAKIKLYDGIAPSTEQNSYILISTDRNAQQTGNKCTFQWQANILIDVVIKNGDQGDNSGNFGFVLSDTIAEQIAGLVNTFTHLSVDHFQVVNTSASFNNLSSLNPTEPTFRTLIRFSHNIIQTT